MIAIIRSSKKIQFSKEQVKGFREGLEQATEESFKEFERIRRSTLERARNIILD